jgi:uncharacterized protein
MKNWDRREFLKFMGRGALAAGAGPLLFSSLSGCIGASKRAGGAGLPFGPLKPSSLDDLVLADGFRSLVLIKWGDPISSRENFGSHNDFTAFIPSLERKDEGVLWVNHEYFQPLFVTGNAAVARAQRKKSDVAKEQQVVGGSILRVRQNLSTGNWEVVQGDPVNRRLNATTPIPFAWDHPVAGSRAAVGTMGNCAGGLTPWRTFLTCEEQFAEFWGERDSSGKMDFSRSLFGWESVLKYPTEHYGWVVEVDPVTGRAKKLVALGRFGHESATVRVARDGRCVVYSGDDDHGACLYKFIADRPGSLERGVLHVADVTAGRWIPLDWSRTAALRSGFKDQTDVLVRAREAAIVAGGSRLDRPEDIEIDPATGAVLVSLTNNIPKKNFTGSILRVLEKGDDPLALEFESSVFLSGGESGFVCPDNLAFDPRGNLWITSDMSGSLMGKGAYEPFGNNGLFYVPMKGDDAGRVFQVASSPVGAEFTGPSFSPDGRTLFLSVQHPGETSAATDRLTSNWPEGGKSMPRSAVVTLQGPAMDALMAR